MITVIDLGISNVGSVGRALDHLNAAHKISQLRSDIINAEKLILPGVGSFSEGMNRIRQLGIFDLLRDRTLIEKIPILGICLGMQLFASEGEEGGLTKGLNLVEGRVCYHRSAGLGFRLPHIGWDEVYYEDFKLFDSITNNSCFYFVHSYELLVNEPVTLAFTNYGVTFTAAVQKENILGVQFHPEKSQMVGLKLLENFCSDRF